MENWGCEFIDCGNQADPPATKFKLVLPIEILSSIVDEEYKKTILTKDRAYIDKMKDDLNRNGLERPLLISAGINGIILADGNHRLVAMEELGWTEAEVNLKVHSSKIKSGGRRYLSVIERLLYECNTRNG